MVARVACVLARFGHQEREFAAGGDAKAARGGGECAKERGVRAGFEGETAGFDVGIQRKAAAGVHLGEAACGDSRQFVIVRGIAKVVVGSKIAVRVEADVFRGDDARRAVDGDPVRLRVDVPRLRRATQRQCAGDAHGDAFGFQRALQRQRARFRRVFDGERAGGAQLAAEAADAA